MVDVRSTDAGLTFTENRFNSLPLEHTYRGLFQLSPGVADNRSAVGLAAGGSRQDNTYLLDGANITSPGVRHPRDPGQSARHRRGEPDPGGRHRRVRPQRRNRGQRREPERLEPVRGSGPRRLAARGAGERLRAAGGSHGRRAEAGNVPGSGAQHADRAGGRLRRPAASRPALLLRLRPLPARRQVGPRQQGRHAAAGRSARGPRVLRQAHRQPVLEPSADVQPPRSPVRRRPTTGSPPTTRRASRRRPTAAAASPRRTGPTSSARTARSTSATSGRARSTRTSRSRRSGTCRRSTPPTPRRWANTPTPYRPT